MRKRVLKMGMYVLASLTVLLLIFAIAIQLLFSNSVKKYVVDTINEHAVTKISVSGPIHFSVLSSFPYVSVDLNKIQIDDLFKSKNDLLIANKISVQINLWNFITGSNTISKITVSDGRASILVDKNGNANYFIFKKSENEDEGKVSINKIVLNRINTIFDDEYSNQHYDGFIKSATLSGNFSAHQFDLSINTEVFFHHVIINGTDYAESKDITLKGGVSVNTQVGSYKIRSTTFTVNAAEFKISGSVQDLDKQFLLDLFITGAESGIAEIGALLPNDYQRYLTNLNTKGRLSFTGTIKGALNQNKNPEILFLFDLKDATIAHRNSKQKIEHVNFQAKFSNGDKRSWSSSYISIQQGSAEFGKAPVTFDILLNQFRNPYLQVSLDGTFSLDILTALIDKSKYDALDGTISVHNFRYRGALRDINSNQALIQSEGVIGLSNIHFKNSVVQIDNLNGNIELSNDLVGLNTIQFTLNGTAFNVYGEMNHFLPVLIRVINDVNYQIPKSYLVNLNIEIGDLQPKFFINPEKAAVTYQDSMAILDRMLRCASGVLNLKIESLNHQDIHVTQISTGIHFSNKWFYFSNLKLNTLKGTLNSNGDLDLSRDDFIQLNATMQLSGIDIKDLFVMFHNFDQQSLTDKNINGSLTTSLSIKAQWYKGVFQSNQLQVMADVTITKGELTEFKPLYALSKFVKIEDLKDIRFSKLSNQITIKNRTVTIPNTVINSNALNLELSGTHTFDNEIDYKVKLNLLQLLSNKFKTSTTFDPDATEKDPSGLLNLYITLKGSANNPEIKYDKRSVKNVIKENMKQEQQAFKDILRKEFNQKEKNTNNEQIKDWQPPQEYELIEFDDDTIPK